MGSLFDALVAMKEGKADDSILDKYSEVRIKKWQDIIDPMSRANFRRVCLDEADSERNEFWKLCEKMEKDDELARQMAQVSSIFRLQYLIRMLISELSREQTHSGRISEST